MRWDKSFIVVYGSRNIHSAAIIAREWCSLKSQWYVCDEGRRTLHFDSAIVEL